MFRAVVVFICFRQIRYVGLDLCCSCCYIIRFVVFGDFTTLWILSYNDFSQKYFEDYGIGIIEKVSKIMDFFSWEKIARIMLMLFDNLKENSIC